MRKVLATLAVLLLAMPAVAVQPETARDAMSLFTWGVRAGFAANSTYVTNAVIDGHTIEDYRQDTQLGNFAAFQFRLNSRKLFLQTGIGIGSNKSTFYIDRNSWDPELESVNELGVSYSINSLMVPLQVGYHLVNNAPYSLSVFTGPRFRLPFADKYESEITGNLQDELEENLPNMIAGWTLGLGIQIGRSFFDFEYECGISDISGGIHPVAANVPDPGITLDRRLGIMSFSFGIMF